MADGPGKGSQIASPEDDDRFLRAAQSLGWSVQRETDKHWVLEREGNKPLVMGKSPRDAQGMRNALARLRRPPEDGS